MRLRRWFTDHPASVGESYLTHFTTASSFAWQLLLAGAACFVHALLPLLFVHTGSECVSRLHQQMLVRRAARSQPAIERSAHQ